MDFNLDIEDGTKLNESKSLIEDDLTIFGNGTIPAQKTVVQSSSIPNFQFVETNLNTNQTVPTTTKSEGFISKVGNMFGFGFDNTNLDSSEKLKQETEQMKNNFGFGNNDANTSWDGYGKVNSVTKTYFNTTSNTNTRPKIRRGKRYYIKKIHEFAHFINDNDELNESKIRVEVNINSESSIETIMEEYEELKLEYERIKNIKSYGANLTGAAEILETFTEYSGVPLYMTGLTQAIDDDLPSYRDCFEKIHEEYGMFEVNPIVSLSTSILKTVIKIHMTNYAMRKLGGSFLSPEMEDLINRDAEQMARTQNERSFSDMLSSTGFTKNNRSDNNNVPLSSSIAGKNSQSKSTSQLNNNTKIDFKSGFDFANDLLSNQDKKTGPPPPIHTKITKPPINEENAQLIKEMARPPMKGPSIGPDVQSFLAELNKIEETPPPPTNSVIPEPIISFEPEKKNTVGNLKRKKKNSEITTSIDI